MSTIIPPRRGEFLTADGKGTTRFHEYLEQTSTAVNATTAETAELNDETGIGSLNAQLLRLRAQVGSGVPISIDTTGFTIDNTQQTIDATEVK